MEKSIGNMSLIVCNDCVNNLVAESKDICNTCPNTAFEIIITMLIQRCGQVCENECAVRDRRIEELKDFKDRMSPGAIR